MSQRSLNVILGGTGKGTKNWRGAFTLPFLLLVSPQALAQTKPTAPVTDSSTQCQSVPLVADTKDKSASKPHPLAGVLDDFEASFLLGNSDRFAAIVSPALMKSKTDSKKIFDGTLLEYDLRRVKLQRNWIWEINIAGTPEPGRLVRCGDLQVQPVFGPRQQYAVQYSAFTGSNQTRLFVVFAPSLVGADEGKPLSEVRPGLVHLQVQRWTYDSRAPERLLAEARQTASAGDTLVGAILAEASARVLEINPYVIAPLLSDARSLATQLNTNLTSQQNKFLAGTGENADWKAEKIVPVFRDGSLAVGIKFRMAKEISVNDQAQLCRDTGRKLFTQAPVWKERFSGFECMPYGATEDSAKPPRGGSQYFTWSMLEKKPH